MFVFDIQYAVRLLLKKPIFTATTIIIMSLGLALSIYAYSLLNTLLFAPLEIKNGDALVNITGEFDQASLTQRTVEASLAKRIRDQAESFSQISIYSLSSGTALISGRDTVNAAKKLSSTFTQPQFFKIAGVSPLLGRVLTAEDHADGAEPVIILGYAVWKNFFSADPDMIDRYIRVDGEPVRVVGVMPEGFAFPAYAQAWQPALKIRVDPTGFEEGGGVFMMAVLKPGVTLAQANAELDGFAEQMRSEQPEHADHTHAMAKSYKSSGMQKHTPLLLALSITVLLIFLLSCINVGNLLLSRVNERLKEIAIRIALGIPRYRLIVQMLWEAIIICLISSVVAVGLAVWAMDISNVIIENAYSVEKNRPYWWHLSIDSDILVAIIILVILTIVLVGVVPTWRALNGDFNAVLRDGTRGALSKKSAFASYLLVVSEIFLSCVVLIIASIILNATYEASQADYGIDPNNTLTGHIELPYANNLYRSSDQSRREEMREKRNQLYRNFKYELEKEPNIISLSAMRSLPGMGGGRFHLDVEGMEFIGLDSYPQVHYESVVVGSLPTLGLKLIEGRYFDDQDTNDKDKYAIVSVSLAQKLYPNKSALGQRIRSMSRDGKRFGDWLQIVGVVSDVIHGSAFDASSVKRTVYFPHTQAGGINIHFNIAVKYKGSEVLARKTMLAALKRVDPDVPIYHIRSYHRLLEEPMFLISSVSRLFLICGLIAFFLAATGIYSIVSNSISLRTQEIGVRRAMGATDNNVLKLFLTKSVRQLVLGVGVGVVTAMFITLKMTDLMAIQTSTYLIAYIAIPCLIVTIVLGATYLPTVRALRVEPNEALQYE